MIRSVTLSFADGQTEVYPFAPADLVRFENHYGLKTMRGLSREDLTVEMVMRLCWFAARRLKRTDLDFDAWLDTVEGIGGEDEDPLDRRNGASPPSQLSQGSPSAS